MRCEENIQPNYSRIFQPKDTYRDWSILNLVQLPGRGELKDNLLIVQRSRTVLVSAHSQ